MLNYIIIFALLVLTWVVLSGFFSPLFLTLAIVSCALSVWASVRIGATPTQHPTFSNILRLPFYLAWLIKEIFLSTFSVAKLVWRPTLNISPAFSWIPTAQQSEVNKTIYANSITLTPGTITVTMRGNQLGVHALEASSLEDLREGTMDRTILRYYKEEA